MSKTKTKGNTYHIIKSAVFIHTYMSHIPDSCIHEEAQLKPNT